MGNEISTIGGAIATAGTAVAAGVTFGQVKVLNDAVVDTANFTAKHAEKTVVRHVGETVVMATATIGASVASGVTFGQVQALNDAVVHCANHTAQAGGRAGVEIVNVADGVTDGTPILGHIKGGICYAIGDHERGERAMKAASRNVGVIAGGVGGFVVGGPPGAVAGGVAAGAAMDGIITGAEFVIHDEFKPHGQVACWHQVANATNADERIGGIINGVVTPVFDGMAGLAAGKAVAKVRQRADIAKLDKANKGELELPVDKVRKLEKRIAKRQAQGIKSKLPPSEAADGNALYDSVEVPEEALADQNDVVYRGDKKFLNPEGRERVFQEGVCPDGNVSLNDALPHVQAEYRAHFVSTSPDVAIARDFGFASNGKDWAFAEIAARNGVRINIAAKFLNKVARFAGQNEYSIFGGIKPQDIKGIYEFARGKFTYHPNPNFVPPVPGFSIGQIVGGGACVLFMTSKALHAAAEEESEGKSE